MPEVLSGKAVPGLLSLFSLKAEVSFTVSIVLKGQDCFCKTKYSNESYIQVAGGLFTALALGRNS